MAGLPRDVFELQGFTPPLCVEEQVAEATLVAEAAEASQGTEATEATQAVEVWEVKRVIIAAQI